MTRTLSPASTTTGRRTLPKPTEPPAVYPYKRPPRVVVVVVNYRTPLETLECVRSLQTLTGLRLGLLVVDNASDDGSAE
ncbi:MAG: hypothetical protein ACRDD1_05565, partial [Planctomycetia bacterium]